ncbi:helix-turn-helix domain-containing protein [Actinoplanes sp. NPDC051475]|uniref:helix-turn-helix domain-containing protein n=1 Tax=Actinoplanes sp. NPDC051475 TaxID=3157225 RepID=UPI00344EFD29
MDGAPMAQSQLYTPAEVACRLRCSEWWVKEQARRRRIPFCWIGGSYRFTEEQVVATVRLFEVQPVEPPLAVGSVVRAISRAAHSDEDASGRLRARAPRRMRGAAPPSTTAA